jgi:MSHA biogenesis protein MshP
MRPDFHSARHARGFGLVAAMFLMIVVTLVILAMSRLSTSQHGTLSLAIQQARAYQAARAGLEWGIAQSLNAGSCGTSAAPALSGTGLDEFTLAVECSRDVYTDAAGGVITLYRLVATAQNGQPGSRADYAYRRLSAVVERTP